MGHFEFLIYFGSEFEYLFWVIIFFILYCLGGHFCVFEFFIIVFHIFDVSDNWS